MSESFNIEIISPEKKLLTDKANSVSIPAFEGEMTILSNHIPLITFLRPGIIKVYANKETEYFVEEGTVEFSNNNLVILSSSILELKDLSKEKISKMIEESKSKLGQENLDDKKRYIISHKVDCLSKINL
tara:strand:- start:9111 stop:9500 length:390 start_codon:yes stop_codon:yes gene_type:complete